MNEENEVEIEKEEREPKRMKVTVQVDPKLVKQAEIGSMMAEQLYKELIRHGIEGFDLEKLKTDKDEFESALATLSEVKKKKQPKNTSGITPLHSQYYGSSSSSSSSLRQEFSSYEEMVQYLLAEEEKGNLEAKEALKNLWTKAIREDIDRFTPREKTNWEIELKGKLKDEIKRKRKEEGD
ncbi:hypothetical protein DRO91_03830 [Candidatus Heimdallarchaeota archaeon]|nr:MAG: hypothetical protein DRO91_03830 [Candidatus Heimdallarchaeota archaeon]